MEHATLMLATSQLGITICSLLILNVSEPAIHHLLEVPLGLTGLTEADVSSVIAFVIALVLVSFLHVVFGEMVPKNLSFSVPDRAVLMLAPPLVLVSRLFRPDHRGAQLDRERRAAAVRGGAQGRGDDRPSRSTRSPTIVDQSTPRGRARRHHRRARPTRSSSPTRR